MKKLTATTYQITDLVGIDKSTLTRWKRLGVDEANVGRNQWDVKAFVSWWADNIRSAASGEENTTLNDERLRYERARADKMELQVSLMKGETKPIEDVHREWAARIAVVVNGLTIYQDRLPPLLEGKSRNQMRAIIKKENHRLREWYVKQGK